MPKIPAPDPAAQGHIDKLDGPVLHGWAIDVEQPERPASLLLVIDDHPLAMFECSEPRDDVNERGVRGTKLGFRFEIPFQYQDGEPHRVAIRFRSGLALPHVTSTGERREEIIFQYLPMSAQGVVDGMFGSSVRGWAFRTDLRTGKTFGGVTIEVSAGGVGIARLNASLIRNDVAELHGCPPHCGFLFSLPPRLRDGRPFALEFRVLPEGTELSGSPFSGTSLALEVIDQLHGMFATVETLCTQIYALKDQMRRMLTADEYTMDTYHFWLTRYLDALRARVLAERREPRHRTLIGGRDWTISVVCPVYRPDAAEFAAAVTSVLAQSWKHWELIIVDDGSRLPELTRMIEEFVASDPRIRVVRHFRNLGISAATNAGIAVATGEYIALLDHDDLLVDVALEVMLLAALNTGAKVIYSDEDKIDAFGIHSEPHLKTDWNYRLLLSYNYICHFLMVEAATLRGAGMLRTEYNGAQDHDLALRLSEIVAPHEIHHVPEILYHWRKTAGSTAAAQSAKSYAADAGGRAILGHLARRGLEAELTLPLASTLYDIRWKFTDEPRVSILIPFRDQPEITRRCVECLSRVTTYTNFEIVLIDNWSTQRDTEAWLRTVRNKQSIRVVRIEENFNFARLNNHVARQLDSAFFLFLNNDIFIEQADWLRIMVDEALADARVGIVGIKLLYPNQTVQHAGVVLGVGGVADHAFKYAPGDEAGYCFRAVCAAEMSAVTAACMLCRADAFRAAGMFDEANLAVAFNDVDLCLRIGRAGYKIVYQPAVVAEHHESLSRGSDLADHNLPRFYAENQTMWDRWGDLLRNDPFYNPHFSHETGIYEKLSNASLDVTRAPSLLRTPPPRATLVVAPRAPILHDAVVRIPLAGENGQSPVAEGATGPRKRSGKQDRGGKRISGKPAARAMGKAAAPTE